MRGDDPCPIVLKLTCWVCLMNPSVWERRRPCLKYAGMRCALSILNTPFRSVGGAIYGISNLGFMPKIVCLPLK